MPDQPEQAPASPTVTAAPAPAAAAKDEPATVKGRWMVRTQFDDFAVHDIVTDLPQATLDMHAHQIRRLQDEPQPVQEMK